jgi:hypothetical protein
VRTRSEAAILPASRGKRDVKGSEGCREQDSDKNASAVPIATIPRTWRKDLRGLAFAPESISSSAINGLVLQGAAGVPAPRPDDQVAETPADVPGPDSDRLSGSALERVSGAPLCRESLV